MKILDKAVNILAVFAFDLFWTLIVFVFLTSVIGFSRGTIQEILASGPLIFSSFLQHLGPLCVFLLTCILAPLWEELVFRKMPLDFVPALKIIRRKWRNEILLNVAFFSSIIFGVFHGGALNILFQGIGGASYCWLYLKNQRCYWSVVIVHSLWNFMIIWGLRYFVTFLR